MNTPKELEFLLELTALTRKHGISIGGCGCCGSPSLEKADVSDERAGYKIEEGWEILAWVAPTDEYLWDEYKDNIVRKQNDSPN